MTMLDVAKLAKVSQSTVSRVVSGQSGVSPEVVRSVQEAIHELGYKPAPVHKRRGRRISPEDLDCVVLLWTSNHMFDLYSSVGHALTRSVALELESHNLGMVLSYVVDKQRVPEFVARGRVRGAIVTGHNPNQELLDNLTRIPHVWINSHASRKGEVVLSGNEYVGRLAAEHLLGRGHQHFAVLNMLPDAAAMARTRFFRFVVEESQKTCLAYIGAEEMDRVCASDIDMDWFESRVEALVDRLLAETDRPTGLFVPSDFQTAMVYRVLAKRGVRVGVDMELVSTDHEKGALMGLYPRPATIDLAPCAMGRNAVANLMARLDQSSDDHAQVLLDPKLYPGDVLRSDWDRGAKML